MTKPAARAGTSATLVPGERTSGQVGAALGARDRDGAEWLTAGEEPGPWEGDSAGPSSTAPGKPSRGSIPIFRTRHLKGQEPSQVFIFLSRAAALIAATASHSPHPHPKHGFLFTRNAKEPGHSPCSGFGFLPLAPTLTPGTTRAWWPLRKST